MKPITNEQREDVTRTDNPSRIFYEPVSEEEYKRCETLLPKVEK